MDEKGFACMCDLLLDVMLFMEELWLIFDSRNPLKYLVRMRIEFD